MSITVANISVPSGLYIGGAWTKGHGEPLDSINPATEEKIATVDTANLEDVDAAVKAARKCFEEEWGTNVAGTERGRLLFAFADAIDAKTEELAMLECLDAGKPIAWCKADIGDSTACLRYYAGLADKCLQGSTIEIDDQSKYALTRKEPIGVCAQIVPWNYPIMMWAWKVAPALATGCAIVFKPAENTPLSTLKLAEIFDTIGYPKGVLNVVNGLGKVTGQCLAEHMDIDKIAFTGSTAVGRSIAIAAAQSNLKRVTLELGGKSANIVFKSANLEEAAKWAAFGIFENAGQSCTAASRTLVEDSIYDEFVKLFVKAAQAPQMGDPLDPKTFQGPQVSKVQYDRILNYVDIAKSESATLLTGGSRPDSIKKGYFVSPTVFADVKMGMRIAQEEVFGPVATLIRFKDEKEAVELANGTSYGLAAAVHSNDANQIHRVTRKIKAGTVWINQYVLLQNQVPFGGYKQSGWGRELGMQGLDTYLTTKAVHHYYGEPLEWPIVL